MRLTFPRIVYAEWTKFVALRSTWLLFAAVVAGTAGLSWAIAANVEEPTASAGFLGVDVFSLVLAVLGIVMITGEYGSGLVRATFAAVPARLPVLPAKAVVLVAVSLPVMAVTAGLSALTFRLVAGDVPGLARAAAGATFAPVLLALVGLGFGAVVRHTAGAITGFVLSMLVLPALLPVALPEDSGETLVKYVPVSAAQALYTSGGSDPLTMLSPTPAAAVLAVWVAVALAAGAATMLRRDP